MAIRRRPLIAFSTFDALDIRAILITIFGVTLSCIGFCVIATIAFISSYWIACIAMTVTITPKTSKNEYFLSK